MNDQTLSELQHGLIVPMRYLVSLEVVAAVICHDARNSNLGLTKDQLVGLEKVKEDEVRHFTLAVRVLEALPKFDKRHLRQMLREQRERHQSHWINPLHSLLRLNRDERTVARRMEVFKGVIAGIVPEEGTAFVRAVEIDEPEHVAWGDEVLQSLIGSDEAKQKFARHHRSVRGWPAERIMREFYVIGRKMGLKVDLGV